MKRLIIAIISFWISNAYPECNEMDSLNLYKPEPDLILALEDLGFAISTDPKEITEKYRDLAPYMSQAWNPKIIQHVKLEYLCTGDGIATVSYNQHSDLPFIVRYCKLFPRGTSEADLIKYVKNRFATQDVDKSREFHGWQIREQHIAHRNRYFQVKIWAKSNPRRGFNPQIQIQVVDNSVFAERQKECLNAKQHNR